MHDTTVATTVLLILLAWGGVGALFFWEHFLRDALCHFCRRSRAAQVLIVLGGVFLVFAGGIKVGDPPLRGPGPAPAPASSLTTNQCLAGFALVDADTNATFSLDAPTNAVVHTNWLLRGASRDAFAIESTDERPWSFLLGTNRLHRVWVSAGGTVSFSGPFDSATGPLPDAPAPDHLAPFHATLGIVPEANWPLLQTGNGQPETGNGGACRSLFWHDTTEAGSLHLTWNNALLDRDAVAPVSFQAELFPSGDFTYRYDFGEIAPTGAVIGAQNNGGGESWTNAAPAQRVELRWRHFSGVEPGAADTDGDGLSDYDEVSSLGTDPARADSDGDGIEDGIDLDPNDCDADGDGIPDGADSSWSAHPLLAGNAGFTNLVLTVVRGMAPPLRSGNAPDASALLDVGGLKIPLRTGDTIPLGLPGGEEITASLRVRGNLPVRLRLSPGPNGEPFHLDDPQGIFSHGTSADATAKLSFPRLSLVPLTDSGTTCLHEGDWGAEFRVLLSPMGWDAALTSAEIDGFELLAGGTLWLDGPPPPCDSATGTVTLRSPWLLWGTLTETASVHWCASGGVYCHACGTVHTDEDSCSHDADCAARFSVDADCDCLALFVRVNSDDDDLDGSEDRFASGIVPGEDDLLAYHAVGESECCCESFGGARVRITGVSGGLRLWTVDGDALATGAIVSNTTFLIEATAPSPTIGAGYVEYDILDEVGETVRSILRRFTMANVQIRADLDGDGTLTTTDAGLKSVGLGTNLGNLWLISRRATPCKVSLRNECSAWDGSLHLSLANSSALGPVLRTGPTTNAPALFPGEATNAAPFCIRNASNTFWLDTSAATNTVMALNYTLDFEGIHAPISDTLYLRVVDIDLKNIAVTTNELSSLVYDFSQASTPVEWELVRMDTDETVATSIGGIFDPPDNLPVDTYAVIAFIDGIHENGHSFAVRSARLDVGSIVFEPQTTELDPTGRHAVNPSCLGKGLTGWFAAEVSENFEGLITWTADPAINVEFPNGTNGPVVSVLGRFFGDTDLRMNIKDFIGPPPQTTVRIMPTNSVPVNVWIVHNGRGTYPATPERVAQCVEKANDIFYHTGLSFHLESISYTNRGDWLVIPVEGTHNWPKANEICAITNGTHGIECYFVGIIQGAYGLNTPYGILVGQDANISTFAHEIGHACGLSDIYISHRDTVLQLNECATLDRNQEDWGTNTARGYYQPGTMQSELVARNVMCNARPLSRREFTRGDIFGIWYDFQINPSTGQREKVWHKSLAPVGMFTNGNLTPQHL